MTASLSVDGMALVDGQARCMPTCELLDRAARALSGRHEASSSLRALAVAHADARRTAVVWTTFLHTRALDAARTWGRTRLRKSGRSFLKSESRPSGPEAPGHAGRMFVHDLGRLRPFSLPDASGPLFVHGRSRRAVTEGSEVKKSLFLALFFMASAGGAGAGAFATSAYVGSDTLYTVTNQAILNAQLGNGFAASTTPPQWNANANPVGDYSGGGSGVGEVAMVGNTQQTAPMSRMLASGACSAADLTQASGIVLAIDAIGIWAAASVVSANTACNGMASTSACTVDPSGIAFSGAGGNPLGFTDWRDPLALLYGGLDRSSGVTDCASPKRAALIGTWANLFQNSSCTNGALTHAWRRDDLSGTADTFASLIGIEAAWKDPNGNTFNGIAVSARAVNGFMTSPYCNAMNWDQAETSATACTNTADKHYIGPGGVVGADGKHHVPPPGTYGSVPAGTQPFVFPTAFQDNDPLRTPCFGNGASHRPAEDVCNIDGNLGVVLPIPALDFVPAQNPGLVAYPSAVQCTGGTSSGPPAKVFKCAPRGRGTFFALPQCPNGDTPFAFGCLVPVGPGPSGPTSQCLAIKSEFPTLCNVGPCSTEARIYNEQVYDGTGAGFVQYLNVTIPLLPGASPALIPHTGGYARIHMREPSAPGSKTCQLADADDQIGCLVQTDTHSIGFAGNAAATWDARDPIPGRPTTTGDTVDLRVNGVGDGVACTPLPPGSPGTSYRLWSKLYFNSIVGFGRVTSAAELALAEFESFDQNTGPIVVNYGFFQLPFSPSGSVPTPFCEDFNEQVVCGAANNLNGCAFNTATDAVGGGPLVNTTIAAFTSLAPGAVTTPGCAGSSGCTIPSDPSSDPMMSTTSTVCGNGHVEALEECDPPGPACSNACRSR
jgi:hypothetical protein